MSALRPIEPVAVSDLTPTAPATGEPIFERVDPRTLHVDGIYQREIGERGLRQIRKMVQAWDWRRFSPPTCVYGEDEDGKTVLIVIDGQHRSIAAASHPGIDAIPVMIVEAKETAEQAKAFVGTNVDRLAVTNLALHRAALAAGDEDALRLQSVVDKADVRLMPSANVKYEAADCTAIAAVASAVKKHGEFVTTQILIVLANAELAPISTPHIKAAELLMTGAEYCTAFDWTDLTTEIIATKSTIDGDARLFAAEHKVPLWRAMAALWFRKVRKRRTPAKSPVVAEPASEPSKKLPPVFVKAERIVREELGTRPAAPRTIVPHHIPTQKNVTAAICGDPAPGRSALDERNARQAS